MTQGHWGDGIVCLYTCLMLWIGSLHVVFVASWFAF